jgi:hypothetical protein
MIRGDGRLICDKRAALRVRRRSGTLLRSHQRSFLLLRSNGACVSPQGDYPNVERGQRAQAARAPTIGHRMDRLTTRIVVSGAFALALYLAIGERLEFMALPVIGFVWTLFALHASSLMTGAHSTYPASPPTAHFPWMLFDLGVLAALFLAGWYLTAFAYAASCGCAQLINARAASR